LQRQRPAPLASRTLRLPRLINVVAGSLVQANAAILPLVSIAQINPIAVTFTLPETQLAPLLHATRNTQDGSKPKPLAAQVLLPAERSATKGQARPPTLGTVSFVDNLVDSTTGTIKVKAEFENSAQTLWPGQYVRVRLQLDTIKDAVVIPQAAIILRGTERSVYVVGADSKVALKVIKVRYPFGEMAVVDGIEAGARVVVDGKQNLRPGNAVREQAAALNPAAAAASYAASGVAQ
ncbi:efflux RND transporter periplasmic adaptor subunit, partial [Roseateles sp. GG27B]